MTKLDRAKQRVEQLLQKHVVAAPASLPLPAQAAAGKVYEAWSLANVVAKLSAHESLACSMAFGSELYFTTAPGPVNRAYPYIEVRKGTKHVADVFLDTEFLGLSCRVLNKTSPSCFGDYHELDIMMAQPNAKDRPPADEIILAVECKHTPFKKSLLREVLGLRRELSYFTGPQNTSFNKWPRSGVFATPPSCLMFYTSDPRVNQYSEPGFVFGIDFVYLPI